MSFTFCFFCLLSFCWFSTCKDIKFRFNRVNCSIIYSKLPNDIMVQARFYPYKATNTLYIVYHYSRRQCRHTVPEKRAFKLLFLSNKQSTEPPQNTHRTSQNLLFLKKKPLKTAETAKRTAEKPLKMAKQLTNRQEKTKIFLCQNQAVEIEGAKKGEKIFGG